GPRRTPVVPAPGVSTVAVPELGTWSRSSHSSEYRIEPRPDALRALHPAAADPPGDAQRGGRGRARALRPARLRDGARDRCRVGAEPALLPPEGRAAARGGPLAGALAHGAAAGGRRAVPRGVPRRVGREHP